MLNPKPSQELGLRAVAPPHAPSPPTCPSCTVDNPWDNPSRRCFGHTSPMGPPLPNERRDQDTAESPVS